MVLEVQSLYSKIAEIRQEIVTLNGSIKMEILYGIQMEPQFIRPLMVKVKAKFALMMIMMDMQ
ncbi:MAG: hypothetical protein HWN67_09115 [Candidatus Helarchaeota archaeon]|nr:hypothetical protein [Candidatus Helarchaeota archaeon]